MSTPETLYLVADVDGELAGSGFAGRSDLGGGVLMPARAAGSAPPRRRDGAASRLGGAARGQSAYETAGSMVEDEGSLAFAERFGFRETGRQVEQVREIRRDEPSAARPRRHRARVARRAARPLPPHLRRARAAGVRGHPDAGHDLDHGGDLGA